ncbi:hypothetical protein FJH32_004511 [Escherichia coli]|nr:hypothetical protein [Escherichia coli]
MLSLTLMSVLLSPLSLQAADIGAGVGSIFGGGIGKIATEQLKPVIKEGSAEVIGAVTGAVSGEVTGNQVKDKLDKVGNKNGSN